MIRDIALLTFCLGSILSNISLVTADETQLSPQNTRVPFSYVINGERTWPVLTQKLQPNEKLVATFVNTNIDSNKKSVSELSPNLQATIKSNGFLSLLSQGSEPLQGTIKLVLTTLDGKTSEQLIQFRPAPPNRPISYVSDMVDDLIHTLHQTGPVKMRPITKGEFDQYFRRVQATGATRLIVWQSPFPYIAKRENYTTEDWSRYEEQTKAILNDDQLQANLSKTGGLPSWSYMSHLLEWRLKPQWGDWYLQSALEHGINLSFSFRPFEPALSKYYRVPAYDVEGNFLWYFHPLCSPAVNYHADTTSFVHYRELLREMGHTKAAEANSFTIENVPQAAELVKRFAAGEQDWELFASEIPPVDPDSFVLQRTADNVRFQLVPFKEISTKVAQNWSKLTDFKVELAKNDGLRFTGLNIPTKTPYLRLRAVSQFAKQAPMPSAVEVNVSAKAGNNLGRLNVYWTFPAEAKSASNKTLEMKTGILGIGPYGGYRTEFQAIDHSITKVLASPDEFPIEQSELVINLASNYEFEMLDFELPATRDLAIKQIRGQLEHPAVDEIFINTRSHIQLGGSYADGPEGVLPIAQYRKSDKKYTRRLTIDRAYVPRSMKDSNIIKELAANAQTLPQISEWQSQEWDGMCQAADADFQWRYQRNLAIARGLRMFVEDLSTTFPQTRIRMVIPDSATVETNVRNALPAMQHKDIQYHGKNYYRHLKSSLNQIPAIGEAMTMIDLSGTNIEPVFIGVRGTPAPEAFEKYIDECVADLKGNRGSSFRGPRSIFYEAQESLRGKAFETQRSPREAIICSLLDRSEEINEVLLYESTDWFHKMPLDNPDLYGNGFIDRWLKKKMPAGK